MGTLSKYDGKEYVLVCQAHIDGPVDDPYFVGMAICPADGVDEDGAYSVYDVLWNCLDDWFCGDMEDEGDACDWDSPDDVTKTMKGYDLESDRIF